MVSSARQLDATSAAGGINDLHRLLLLAAKRRTLHKIDRFLLVIPPSGECNSPLCFKGVQTTFIDGLDRASVVRPSSLAGPPNISLLAPIFMVSCGSKNNDLFIAQGHHRVHSRCSSRRNPAR